MEKMMGLRVTLIVATFAVLSPETLPINHGFDMAGGLDLKFEFRVRTSKSLLFTSYHWGGFGQGGLAHQFWHKLWLHFFWPTFWLHCILYRTYIGGEAPPISKIQNTM